LPPVIFNLLGRGDISETILGGCCIFPRGADAPQEFLYDLVTFGREVRLRPGAMIVHKRATIAYRLSIDEEGGVSILITWLKFDLFDLELRP
jgi:hypothetical protein